MSAPSIISVDITSDGPKLVPLQQSKIIRLVQAADWPLEKWELVITMVYLGHIWMMTLITVD